MTARLMATLGVLALGVTLAGCGNSSGTGSTGGTSAANGGGTTMPNGAPKVQKPLQAQQFIANQCSSLTAQQLSSAHVSGPGTNSGHDEHGSSCSWGGNGAALVTFSWDMKPGFGSDPVGLDFLYFKNKQDGYFKYWETTDVSGYPAVFADSATDRNGSCRISVGINDQLIYEVNYINPNNLTSDQECNFAKQLAADVITNVQKGGS